MNKKIVITLGVVTYLLSSFGSFAYFRANSVSTANYEVPVDAEGNPIEDALPKTEECPLNGQMYSKTAREKWEKQRPIGIMVENSVDARPQSGISSADVVHEAVAEGGITRFLLVYYCDIPQIVGPVRSARVYFIRLLQGFGENPLYLHIGGANTDGPADALGLLDDIGWRVYNDIDGLTIGLPIYKRLKDRLPNRAWEHIGYAEPDEALRYAKEKRGLTNKDEDGVKWTEDWEPWEFQDDAKENDRGAVSSISYGFWAGSLGKDFTVSWDYDSTTNLYKRSNGGKPHLDLNTDEQLSAKNVIVIFADESVANDGYEGGQHLLYDVVGGDDALIFHNGNVIEGSWEKEDAEDMMRFYDEDGDEIELVRGKIWISVLPTGNEVDY